MLEVELVHSLPRRACQLNSLERMSRMNRPWMSDLRSASLAVSTHEYGSAFAFCQLADKTVLTV